MNNFNSDDQRKAVMANLNKNKKVNDGSILMSITIPHDEPKNRMLTEDELQNKALMKLRKENEKRVDARRISNTNDYLKKEKLCKIQCERCRTGDHGCGNSECQCNVDDENYRVAEERAFRLNMRDLHDANRDKFIRIAKDLIEEG